MAKPSKNLLPRSGLVAAGVIGFVALVVAAMVFTNSKSAQTSLQEADAMYKADMSLAAQDVAMKSIAQLVILAQDFELGVAGVEAVDAAATEAQRAITEYENRIDEMDGGVAEELAPLFSSWTAEAETVIGLARGDDPNAASTVLVTELVPVAEQIAEVATDERDARSDALESAQSRFGSMATVAGFLTAFVLPLLAMFAYRQTMRRQLEVSEAHLEARLEAEKAVGRAKDQFIANISHELRTPLTSIYGFSEVLLEEGFVDPTMATDLVGLINGESAELARMVEDLLVAAHDEDSPLAIESVPVDIAAELAAVLPPFQRRGIDIGGHHTPGKALGDPLRIRQILRNLIANAIKHGGPTVNVFGSPAGDNYVVSVEDDGEGVPEHLQGRLFTRFIHQGDSPLTAGSVGLGLAVAHWLADQMGGSLEYERIDGRTSFSLVMPLTSSAPATVVDRTRTTATS